MQVRRFSAAVVGILLVVVMMATLFLSPGIRHTHEGGDEGHSHAVTHADSEQQIHAHSHGGHSHSHAEHSHGLQSQHSHSHDDGGEVNATESHVHISFLWFELTLPDFFGSDHESTAANASQAGDARPSAQSSATVVISPPFTMTQLVQLVFLTPAPLPERTTIPVSHLVRWMNPASLLKAGRLPDAPLLPPPKFA